MAKKPELIRTILAELELAKLHPWAPPPSGPVRRIRLPPLLPVGDGNQLPATEALIDAVSSYADILADNEPELKSRFKSSELRNIARLVFGKVLFERETNAETRTSEGEVRKEVDAALTEAIERHDRAVDLLLGCWLIEDEGCYPIEIGPVRFEPRAQWLARAATKGSFTAISTRRIRAAWSGKRLSRRKAAHLEVHNERSIIDAVGPCPIVCTVRTKDLSAKLITEKGLLASRLAMSSLSLMWNHPSKGLEWMNLVYDGRPFSQDYATLYEGLGFGSGSSNSQLPSGYRPESDFEEAVNDHAPIFARLGEAIASYVRPKDKLPQPTLARSLFLSLWWYHQACRESSDQMATTKFAASMDALAGGDGDRGILDFLQARVGCQRKQQLLSNGQSAERAIERIYKAGRSKLVHGSSRDYAQDWSGVRSAAEAVGRLCLVEACQWMADNPGSDELEAMRRV